MGLGWRGRRGRIGYYAQPRAATTEELAKGMGVSRTTFEEHLRKAESRVIPRLGALIEAHPGLAEAAKAQRGRRPKRLARFDTIGHRDPK